MTEIWRKVKGYKGRYKVSNYGRIKTKTIIVPREGHGGYITIRGRIMSTKIPKSSRYAMVRLIKNKRPTWILVHRLVWIVFKGKIPNGMEIDHKDTERTNNCLFNLRLVTHKRNMELASINGLMIGARGQRNHFAKLSDADTERLRGLRREGYSRAALAEIFDISEMHAGRIYNNRARKKEEES